MTWLINSFTYYGTDDLYLNYVARVVKPGGAIAIAGAGLAQEIQGAVPDHLRAWWTNDLWSLHSAEWWRRHWERTGIVKVDLADTMAEGWRVWLEWHKVIAAHNLPEIQAFEADQGSYLGYVRVSGQRQESVALEEAMPGIPEQYRREPLLRS